VFVACTEYGHHGDVPIDLYNTGTLVYLAAKGVCAAKVLSAHSVQKNALAGNLASLTSFEQAVDGLKESSNISFSSSKRGYDL
jgi:hypothetical protein